MVDFALIDDGHALDVAAEIETGRVRIAPDAVRAALGWELKPQGLCRGDTCIPVRPEHGVLHPDGIDLGALAEVLHRPLALDVDERVAWLGASAADRGALLRSLDAPDFSLPDVSGRLHSLGDQRGRKVLLLAWASW
jgi:hypothetical protein